MREMTRRSLRTSAVAVVISAGAFINVSKNSNIRTVEIVVLLALGVSIGVFLMNLMLVLKLKKP